MSNRDVPRLTLVTGVPVYFARDALRLFKRARGDKGARRRQQVSAWFRLKARPKQIGEKENRR